MSRLADLAKHLVKPATAVTTAWPRVRDTCNNLGWQFDDWQDDLGRLLHYNAADWQGVGCHPECAYWQGVQEWRDSLPLDEDGTPGGPLFFNGPDVPLHPVQVGDRWYDEAHPGEVI